jgi:hypothetical protein
MLLASSFSGSGNAKLYLVSAPYIYTAFRFHQPMKFLRFVQKIVARTAQSSSRLDVDSPDAIICAA